MTDPYPFVTRIHQELPTNCGLTEAEIAENKRITEELLHPTLRLLQAVEQMRGLTREEIIQACTEPK